MIGTIRKHSSWLWAIIITATIVSFVIFFTPNAGNRSANAGSGDYGSINGVTITRADYVNAHSEAVLRYFFMTGSFPTARAAQSGFDELRDTYLRLFFIQKMNDYGIHVDSAAVAQMGHALLQQLGTGGQAVALNDFVDQVLTPHGMRIEDFERYIRHELGLQQLISVIGLSGDLITPKHAEALFIRQTEPYATEAVFFSGSNYLSRVPEPSPEELSTFYTNMAAQYRLPERVQLNYVSFEATNYVAKAEQQLTNLTELVESNMRAIGTNYQQLAKTPEEAQTKLRELIIHREALMLAREKADTFANILYGLEQSDNDTFLAQARTNGLAVKTTAPFSQENGPAEIEAGPTFAREAFSLSADMPFAGPVIDDNGAYVVSFARRLPSELEPLAEIRDRVASDYRLRKAEQIAREEGAKFGQAVTSGMAEGKTFEEIASQANVKTVNVPPVSLSTQELPEVTDHVSLNQYQYEVISTPVGKASMFRQTPDGGFVVYVREKLPIDQAKMKEQMPEFVRSLRQERRNEAINAWLQREAGQALQDTPLAKQQQQTQAPGQSPS